MLLSSVFVFFSNQISSSSSYVILRWLGWRLSHIDLARSTNAFVRAAAREWSHKKRKSDGKQQTTVLYGTLVYLLRRTSASFCQLDWSIILPSHGCWVVYRGHFTCSDVPCSLQCFQNEYDESTSTAMKTQGQNQIQGKKSLAYPNFDKLAASYCHSSYLLGSWIQICSLLWITNADSTVFLWLWTSQLPLKMRRKGNGSGGKIETGPWLGMKEIEVSPVQIEPSTPVLFALTASEADTSVVFWQ